MTFKPFYRDPVPTSGIVIEAELIEITKPGDKYQRFRGTGRARAFVGGWRVPVRFVMFLNYLHWRWRNGLLRP